jgi:tetratricopeptide (TPR) repeat protein
MRYSLITIFLLNCLISFAQTSNYEKAWQSLNTNNRMEAEKYFQQAMNEPGHLQDAYIAGVYLKSYNGKEKEITDFVSSFYEKSDNPYPYMYALWFNQALLGPTGKKSKEHQLKLIDKLIADEHAQGSLSASASYQKGMHLIFSADFDKAQKYFDAIGNIKNWQYAGPFENISESGYYKDYGPLDHPEPDAVFTSMNNAAVKWITPPFENREGWIPLCYQFNKQTAVAYAQNFVSSSADQTVYCNIGVSGSIKVWINDVLVIAESKERVTDMDVYTVKYNLKKGVNRVLVQLGFTNASFPNFTLRFTDDKFMSIADIKGSPVFARYPKEENTKNTTLLPHFAEAYFSEKIAKEPGNLLNYLLLTDTYLRSKKIIEARNTITDAIEKAPDNALLKMKLVEVLIKENNRTLLLEELEKIKQADTESLVVLDLKIKNFFDNQKYADGTIALEKRITLFGEDETTAAYKIMTLIHEKKYDELVKEAEKMYAQYPENAKLVEMMYTIKKDVYKDSKGALKVYETYMKNNYDYYLYQKYASTLEEQGNSKKALEAKVKLAESFPYNSYDFNNLAKNFYASKQYDKAEDYVTRALALSPYNENYWEQMGDILSEKKNTAGARQAYSKSLEYDPNQYSIINKIRRIDGKPETNKILPEVDIDQIVKDDKESEAKNTDYGYYYMLDQKDVIMHPGGATEEYYTVLIKITNEKGIDAYKESSISYSNSQSLLIEKAEVIKKSRAKIEGEKNGNEIVFTNLEVGDVVVFKYRLQSYVYGRFAKEFWDRYYFGGQIYTASTKYNLLLPANQKINYQLVNTNLKPDITNVEDFKKYSWELLKPEPVKDEPLMPVVSDVCPMLHVSTISDWNEISNWYADICNNKAEEDFEILILYKKLFPDNKKLQSEFEKAKIIYDYIESNIRYSSVSFRQSAYVPQRPSATLTTRLGDCKDLSSLFVTLAHKAGINAQMVLVNTSDNGLKQIILPCVEFNHCIAKAVLDKKEYYIELTDNYLPFSALPNNILDAAVLEIPSKSIKARYEMQILTPPNRMRNVIRRAVDILPDGSDLAMKVKTLMYGNSSSGIRSNYLNLDNDKQKLDMEKTIAGRYTNNVKLDKLSFKSLDKLNDSVEYTYNFKVKNEIIEIGSLQTFKIIYPDMVASLDNFSADTREYTIQYHNYEDVDEYETVVNIKAPDGKKIIEVPVSENLVFKDMKFSLQYKLTAPDKLIVVRKFTNGRKNIAAEDYQAFKTFFEKIVKAEQKFIAYK